MPRAKPISTADRLLSFRERLAKHYAAVRKGKVSVKPSIAEFDSHNQVLATIVAAQEFSKHEAALALEESFKKNGHY